MSNETKAAPAVPQGEPVAWMVWAGILDMRPVMTLFATKELAEAHARQIKSNTEVRPVPATPAAPSQPVTRPQNCGTSYCSCIECVCEPSQPVTLTDGLIEKGAMTGMVDAQIDDIIAALRDKGGV